MELTVPESWLPELADGEYWPFQLEGCMVVTEAGRLLGTLVEVIPNPANDLWVARDDSGTETLVPALAHVIVEVDLEARTGAGPRRPRSHGSRRRRTPGTGPRC